MMALGSVDSIKSLILVDFIRKQVLIVGIYMSDPDSLISSYNLFP